MRGVVLPAAAWAACAWACIFAIPSFYWALGGTGGLSTISRSAVAADPSFGFIVLLWVTGGLKLGLGAVALALRTPPADRQRRMLLSVALIAGLGMALYGTALFVQHALMLAGWISTPEGLGSRALHWHLVLWDPWWFTGGVLFLLSAHGARKRELPPPYGPARAAHPSFDPGDAT